MIINIVGTSGAGKSHLVRWFLREGRGQLAPGAVARPVMAEGRKAPAGYSVFVPHSGTILAYVIGAYEAASSGGCDTFGGDGRIERLYREITDRWEDGQARHIIYEGVMMMNHTRGITLWNVTKALVVLRLTTGLPECIEAVRARRVEVGKDAHFNTKNTEDTYRRTVNYCSKLKALGCPVHPVTRDEAPGKLLELLRS